MPSVGNCCTLADLQFVFITPLNDFFFNTIPLKNSVHYSLHFIRGINWWVCRSAVENIFWMRKEVKKKRKRSVKQKMKTFPETDELLSSFGHFCITSLDVIIARSSQMHQHSSSSSSFFLFSANLFLFFLGGGRERERWCVPDTAVLAHPSGIW